MHWLIDIAPFLDAAAKVVTAVLAALAFIQAKNANKKIAEVKHQTDGLVEKLQAASVQEGRRQVVDEQNWKEKA